MEQTRIAQDVIAARAGGIAANTGTMTKATTHCGHAGRLGLEAAWRAAKGFTTHADISEFPSGDREVCFGEGFDRVAVTRDFGQPFHMADPGVAI